VTEVGIFVLLISQLSSFIPVLQIDWCPRAV